MHRRDFLHPRHVAQAAGQVLGALDELSPLQQTPLAADEVALLRLGWRAMATRYEILLPFDTPNACPAAQAAFDLLDELEDQLSVYRDHSEVCRINRLAAHRPVRVESCLFGLLQRAQQISRESGGAFDITAHALIQAWGFFRGPRRVPSDEDRALALERVGMQHVELNPEKRTVRYHRDGLGINLGSIGKGYALDRMANLLQKRWNLPAVLLHGGSSSVYAKGALHEDGRGWLVQIRHPWQPDRFLAGVWLRDRALGTSAATFQYLEHAGKKLGHVLDPRTGWPAEGLASVSVVAPTATLADALSTAFYVGGLDLARRYCQAHPEVGAVVLPEGAREAVVVGLAPGEYTIAGQTR
jgi:thiamine biosynthesis lipoprotein